MSKINSTPPLDQKLFQELLSILSLLNHGKRLAVARLLGVSTKTIDNWRTTPPTMPWWNMILREVITRQLNSPASIGRSYSKKAEHRQHIKELLHSIPFTQDIVEDTQTSTYKGATRHLAHLLAPHGMYFHDIIKPANSGGYSAQALRKAAHVLGVKKTREGFGAHKKVYWLWPTEDSADS